MTVAYTPTDAKRATAQEFDDGDAPEATNINPLGEAAFDTATYAANRIGAYRVINLVKYGADATTDLCSNDRTGYGLGPDGAEAGAVDYEIGSFAVVTNDLVAVQLVASAEGSVADTGSFRLAWQIGAGAKTGLHEVQLQALDTDNQAFTLLGLIPPTTGTLHIWLQCKAGTTGVDTKAIGPWTALALHLRPNT